MNIVYTTDLGAEKLKARGKVRDIYDLGDELLIVSTDRISAFDVIMGRGVPEKGIFLNKISEYWFRKSGKIIQNHLITTNVEKYPPHLLRYRSQLEGRSMLVRKCRPMPIECIVRGYITGSGWNAYKESGEICSIKLPDGLVEFQRLPEPIFTPSTKAESGHDENISYDKAVEIVGEKTADFLRKKSIELYNFAARHMEANGLIVADTKFEFGRTDSGEIILIDEALTPDSSRFWDADEYSPGKKQLNFDKQILRDYLLSLDWDKTPPAPELPDEIIDRTRDRYRTAYDRIVGK